MHHRIRQRDTLEIIIDTCSLGTAQLQAINTLVNVIQTAHPRIYNDYRIVVPVQLGTEVRQRIYPEFLQHEMGRPLVWDDGTYNLRKFWHKHLDHIQIVDTGISQAYRLHYAKTALPLVMGRPELHQKIVAVAQDLAKRYGAPQAVMQSIDLEHFAAFCEKLGKRIGLQEHEHHAASTLSINQGKKSVINAELNHLARHQRVLDRKSPPEAKYFMQALYSEQELYTEIARTPSFKNFRFNKGERAIEDFIFHERTENNSRLVSLIVSEDAEARDEIKTLRDRSHNSVIVVNKSGLLHAVDCLTDPLAYEKAFSPKPLPAAAQPTPQQKWAADPRNQRAPRIAKAKLKETAGAATPVLDEITEHQFSLRLVKLIETGQWRPRKAARAAA